MDFIVLIIILLILTFLIQPIIDSCNRSYLESFCGGSGGACVSLESNYGPMDNYLTEKTDRGYYDPYKYWNGLPMNLPTRNLEKRVFYPYLYEYNVDRYARL